MKKKSYAEMNIMSAKTTSCRIQTEWMRRACAHDCDAECRGADHSASFHVEVDENQEHFGKTP
jgi:hypothetical protein